MTFVEDYLREKIALEDFIEDKPTPNRDFAFDVDDIRDPILDMRVGQTGYTTPWAFWIDEDGKWLNPHYKVRSEPRGTSDMRITRKVNGWEVMFADEADREHYTRPQRSGWRYRDCPVKSLHRR